VDETSVDPSTIALVRITRPTTSDNILMLAIMGSTFVVITMVMPVNVTRANKIENHWTRRSVSEVS
jgi:hypothetical protein